MDARAAVESRMVLLAHTLYWYAPEPIKQYAPIAYPLRGMVGIRDGPVETWFPDVE